MSGLVETASADRHESLAPSSARGEELEFLLQRTRLLLRLRIAWLRSRSTTARPGGRFGISHAEVDSILNDEDRPERERAWQAGEIVAQEMLAELTAIDERFASLEPSRLRLVKQVFGLTAAEVDLLQLCLAISIDPGLTRALGYMHHHPGRSELTEALAARVLGQGRMPVWTEDAALFRWDLLHRVAVAAGEPDAIVCDPVVRDWFLDRDAIDPLLAGIAREVPAMPEIPGWPVDIALEFIDRAVHSGGGRVRCVVTGPVGSGRRTFAAIVAARLGMPALAVDSETIDDRSWRAVSVRAQRYAFLYRCALVWSGDGALLHAWPQGIPPFPIQFVTCEPGLAPPPMAGVLDRTFELPLPTVSVRERLWTDLVPQAASWDPASVHELAARYRAWPGDIAKVQAEGVPSPQDAAMRLRECARGRLGELAQLLECPFEPSDLVLPQAARDALDDFVYEAAARAEFWDQPQSRRLFPQGRGLLALFAGPPGTGKTMAAQVIAGRLGMDLYRINYASMVSKWVGETAKNTQALLHKAASMDCVLLFDEADAMFARRTGEMKDAQDKFANTDASHLMVAIENYGGIVILASNLKGHIDPAFLRRLRYVVDFPKPDAGQRLEIWEKLVTSLAGAETCTRLRRELQQLAPDVDATGSQIKFGLLGALFGARREGRPLGLDHLLRGLNRELTKEGRGLSNRERERIAGDVG